MYETNAEKLLIKIKNFLFGVTARAQSGEWVHGIAAKIGSTIVVTAPRKTLDTSKRRKNSYLYNKKWHTQFFIDSSLPHLCIGIQEKYTLLLLHI